MQREREKRRKAEEKRKRRLERKTESRKAQSESDSRAEDIIPEPDTADHEISANGDDIALPSTDSDGN
jgi:hypothetical protein